MKIKDNFDNHQSSIPADIIYLKYRWKNKKYKNMLIIGNSKYNQVFNFTKRKTMSPDEALSYNIDKKYDCILCYHSLSEFNIVQASNLLKKLQKALVSEGEIYLTILSKDSFFYKNNMKNNNQLYLNQTEVEEMVKAFDVINIEYTYRLTKENKNNPHYYLLVKKMYSI